MLEQDIKTLMTLAKKDPRDYALLKLMASTGLRVSDIVRLRRDQMIDSDGQVYVYTISIAAHSLVGVFRIPAGDDDHGSIGDEELAVGTLT